MYEIQYVLLFLAGAALTTGAWTGRAAGFCAGAGVFVWAALGFASTALVVPDPGGGTMVMASPTLSWLAFGNAAMHAVVLVLHLHEVLVDADEDAESIDPMEIAGQAEPQLNQQDAATDLNDLPNDITEKL